MEGFELAGRTVSRSGSQVWAVFLISFIQLRVNTVHEKGSVKYTQQDSLEENGGESMILYFDDLFWRSSLIRC